MLHLYHLYLEEIAEECRSPRGPLWRRPEVLSGGLPLRQKLLAFRGINRLLLWHVSQSATPPAFWAPCSEEIAVQVAENWTVERQRPEGYGLVVAYRPRHGQRSVLIPSWVQPVWAEESARPQLQDIVERLEPLRALFGQRIPPSIDNSPELQIFWRLKALVQREFLRARGRGNEALLLQVRGAMGQDGEELICELGTSFLLAHFKVAVPMNSWSEEACLDAICSSILPSVAGFAQTIADRVGSLLEPFFHPEPSEEYQEEFEPTRPSVWSPETLETSAGIAEEPEPSFAELGGEIALELGIAHSTTVEMWEQIGSDLQRRLTCGESLPHSVAELCEACDPHLFGRLHSRWELLVRRHLRACWPHLFWRFSYSEFASSALPWDSSSLLSLCLRRAEPHGTEAMMSSLEVHELGSLLGEQPCEPLNEGSFLRYLFQSRRSSLEGRSLNRAIRWRLAHGSPVEQYDLFEELYTWENLVEQLMQHPAYRREARPRRDGSLRWLDIPSPQLAIAQRAISQSLACYFPAHGHCAGYAPYRSPAYHARIHAGARAAVLMDISDFFGSVGAEHLEPWLDPGHPEPYPFFENSQPGLIGRRLQTSAPLAPHPLEGWSDEGREALLTLLLHPGREGGPRYLAQGAPSSPILANLAAFALDARVCESAQLGFRGLDWSYSRYADDLVLSTRDDDPAFLERASRILGGQIRAMGWRPNRRKTRRWAAEQGEALMICGIRVPNERREPLSLPRRLMRRARVAMHRSRQGLASPDDRGLLSYVYSTTAQQRYRAFCSYKIEGVARLLAGAENYRHFLAGWAG